MTTLHVADPSKTHPFRASIFAYSVTNISFCLMWKTSDWVTFKPKMWYTLCQYISNCTRTILGLTRCTHNNLPSCVAQWQTLIACFITNQITKTICSQAANI